MTTIITEKDIKNIQGKFIVQLNKEQNEPCYVREFKKTQGFG